MTDFINDKVGALVDVEDEVMLEKEISKIQKELEETTKKYNEQKNLLDWNYLNMLKIIIHKKQL